MWLGIQFYNHHRVCLFNFLSKKSNLWYPNAKPLHLAIVGTVRPLNRKKIRDKEFRTLTLQEGSQHLKNFAKKTGTEFFVSAL